MTKTIETLVDDVNNLLEFGFEGGVPPEDLCDEYGNKFAELLKTRFIREPKVGLRMSNAGKPCERQLYYEINTPEDGEKLRPETYAKFLYGDMIELFMLFMAEATGHRVEGTQDTQDIAGIKGHRDAVIDGTLVDVKSASSFSFKRFAAGELKDNDGFGYIGQLQNYLHAGQTDPVVTDKSRGAFFVMDKVLGHICLDFHDYDPETDWEAVMERKKAMVSSTAIPDRGYEPVPDGKSGNTKLGINCSYCAFSKKCWPEGRQFLYYDGIRTLIDVKSTPRVQEIT